jgi:hypothetical protein
MVYHAAFDRRRLMALRIWIAGLLIATAACASAVADQSPIVEAVTLGGHGVLTKCRNWFVASTCNQYHHIRLPPRVAVGDAISVTFGSSRKEFVFRVARIAIEDHHCTIYSTAQESLEGVDKIDVASCYRTDEGR